VEDLERPLVRLVMGLRVAGALVLREAIAQAQMAEMAALGKRQLYLDLR
jgi:hypothetical protein